MSVHRRSGSTWVGCPPQIVGSRPQIAPKNNRVPVTDVLDVAAQRSLSCAGSMRHALLPCLLIVCAALSATAAPPKKKAPVAVPAAATGKKTPASVQSATPDAAPSGDAPQSSVRGPTRIDFDDRLIQGQSNKSGAVYLYDRKELKIRSMIKKRENFREEIVGSLYDS